MVEFRTTPTITTKNQSLHQSNLSNGPFSHLSPLKLSINLQNNPHDIALASFPKKIPTKNQGISNNWNNINHQLLIISYHSYIGDFLEETK